MKVFVTGHLGYIGPHLVELLKAEGHFVAGCDKGLFRECQVAEFVHPDLDLGKDIRDLTVEDLKGFDCVMHLAAISNDPMGDMDPRITYSINREGSIQLARLSKQAGVKRFLFSSSCSIYGQGNSPFLKEDATFNPLTAYAISKIDTETALREMADEHFSPVYLRNSTAYGFSPMFRIDLVVNNLLTCAITKGDIKIKSDGEPWRPLIHCRDIARAFVALLHAPQQSIHNKAINIGGNNENYQVKEVAALVQKFVPHANIVFTGETGADPRNYRVSFDLLGELLPDFALEYTLESGMKDLFDRLITLNFSAADFDGDRFVRLKLLQKHMDLLNPKVPV